MSWSGAKCTRTQCFIDIFDVRYSHKVDPVQLPQHNLQKDCISIFTLMQTYLTAETKRWINCVCVHLQSKHTRVCVCVYVWYMVTERGDVGAVSSNGRSSFTNVMNMIFHIHHKDAHARTHTHTHTAFLHNPPCVPPAFVGCR